MKRGVVLSINKRSVTLLTPEGEFLKTKRQGRLYKVGEEISFSTVKPKFTFSLSTLHLSAKKTVVLSLTSSFLILISILPSLFSEHVSAYMTIDVNPSIELELNDELEVLKLTGLNGDGKLVIRELSNWKGKNINTVTNRIVKTTKQLGYLKGKNQIVVSTTLLDDNKELDKNLKAEIKKFSNQNHIAQTNLKVIPATKNDRKQAREQGISTGKYVEKKLDKENEKGKGKTQEPVKKKHDDSSTRSKNNSRKKELHKSESETVNVNKEKLTEKNQKVVKPLVNTEEPRGKKVDPHPEKQKVNIPKENESRHHPQKELATKQHLQKEKAPKQQPQKEKRLEHHPQKEKRLEQHPQKEKAVKQHPQKQHPQKKKAPKQQPMKEKEKSLKDKDLREIGHGQNK